MTEKTLSADSPEVQEFMRAWHENQRAPFVKQYNNIEFDSYKRKTAKDRKLFIALDEGGSGMFLVERATGHVFSIKAYGVPNRRIGTLAGLARAYWAATAEGREMPRSGYVAADHALNLASQKADEWAEQGAQS